MSIWWVRRGMRNELDSEISVSLFFSLGEASGEYDKGMFVLT